MRRGRRFHVFICLSIARRPREGLAKTISPKQTGGPRAGRRPKPPGSAGVAAAVRPERTSRAEFRTMPGGQGSRPRRTHSPLRRRISPRPHSGSRRRTQSPSRSRTVPGGQACGTRGTRAPAVLTMAGPARFAVFADRSVNAARSIRHLCVARRTFGERYQRFGILVRLFGSTGPGQQAPLDVTFAGGQHAPLPVGMRPAVQQRGPIGTRMIRLHWLLFGPPGAWPAGQQTPVEVILLARQQELPVDT